MKSIPEGQLIKVKLSSLYIGEIYSSTIPTMDEITRLATPKPRNDYKLYHGSPIIYPKTKCYQPLLLASNAPEIPKESDEDDEKSKTIGDCVWDCFLKQLGLNITMGVADGAVVGGSVIPKSWVRDTAKSTKVGKFVPIPRKALGSYSRIKSIPSIIQMRSQEKGSIWNNKLINNKFMQGDKQKLARRIVIDTKRLFIEKRFIDKITKEAGTRGLLRFAGCWIPWFGWMLQRLANALTIVIIARITHQSLKGNMMMDNKREKMLQILYDFYGLPPRKMLSRGYPKSYLCYLW